MLYSLKEHIFFESLPLFIIYFFDWMVVFWVRFICISVFFFYIDFNNKNKR